MNYNPENLLKDFWKRKTLTFSLLRIIFMIFLLLQVINVTAVKTGLLPNGFVSALTKCQEVRSMYAPSIINCYTIVDKKYWSISRWSSISEPRDPNAMPPGHYGTMEHPSI